MNHTFSPSQINLDNIHLSLGPRLPHPPRNFTIDATPRMQRHNDSVYARVSWRPPRSDYPVDKYKLTCEMPVPAESSAFLSAATSVSQQVAFITEVNARKAHSTFLIHNIRFMSLLPSPTADSIFRILGLETERSVHTTTAGVRFIWTVSNAFAAGEADAEHYIRFNGVFAAATATPVSLRGLVVQP